MSGTDDVAPPWYRSTRYFLAVISSFGMVNTFLQRGDLSMAIVCMVNHTAVDILTHGHSIDNVSLLSNDTARYVYTGSSKSTTITSSGNRVMNNITADESPYYSCGTQTSEENTQEKEDGELVWDKETQGLVLGGLFWGYMCLQIFCSIIVQRWGSKKVVAIGMFFMSVLTLLTPVTARWSPWAVLVLRAIMGVFNGFTIPGLFGVWGKWAPPTERSRLICITYSGNISATALVFPLSAFLCKLNFAGGWPSVFYLYGVLGLCWTCIWLYCMYDEPAHHPRIHPKEQEYIEATLGRSTQKCVSVPTPWLKICTSLPFLGIVCAQVTYNWCVLLMMSNLPLYMKEVLHFDIKSNGAFSFIPYLAMFLVILLGSFCADALIEKQFLSVRYTRKLMTVIGHLVPGILLITLSYLDCTQSHIAVAILTLAIGLGGFAFSGILINFYDIAPIFATKIMTISNAISMIPGILAPYVVAEITIDKTREQWQIVFFLTAGLLGLGTFVYLIIGQGHVQKWAVIRDTQEEEVALPS